MPIPGPFRLKIVLWYGGLVLLTLLTVRLASVGGIRGALYSDLDESLRAETFWMRDVLREQRARAISDAEIRAELAQRSRLSPRKEFLEIYDIEGREYFRSPNLEADTLRVLARAAGAQFGDPIDVRNLQRVDLRLLAISNPDFEIYVAYPLTDVDAAVANTVSMFLYLIPLAVALAVAGGYFLVSRFLAPLRWLDRYAEELVDLPLDRELPPPPARESDEIDRLVNRIHDIVDRIRSGVRRTLGFSSLASHELRTPLAVIRSQLEDALREGASEDDLRDAVSGVYDEVLRLDRVVADLLSLAAIEARTIQLEIEPIDLGELAAAFAEDAALLCEASGVHFDFLRGPPRTVRVDPARMRQVLFNLLDNALKHTPPGGSVELRQEDSGEYAALLLADTGSGIPEEHLDRIFDPFFRPRGRSRGIGVGLALVRWLVEAHGGRVEVRSEVGGGTTFTVRLPVDAEGV